MPFDSQQETELPEADLALDGSDLEGFGLEGFGEAEDTAVEASPVVVRRNAVLSAVIGYAASAVAIAYLWRASQTMTVLDWSLFGVMAAITVVYLVALVDSRTPLLVADDLGVRIRLGDEWRGLPWDAIGQVVVHPRRGMLRDGRLVFTPRSLARALEGLDAKARRHVTLNQKMYGAALAVPVGPTTRVSTAGERSVADEIAALALGRADVVELDPRTLEVVDRAVPAEGPADDAPRTRDENLDGGAWSPTQPGVAEPGAAEPEHGDEGTHPRGDDETAPLSRAVFPAVRDGAYTERGAGPDGPIGALGSRVTPATVDTAGTVDTPGTPGTSTLDRSGTEAEQAGVAVGPAPARTPRRSILGGIGTIVSRVAKGRSHDVDGDPARPVQADADDAPTALAPPVPPAALRETRPGLRAEATIDVASSAGHAGSADPDGETFADGRELHRPGSVDLVFERVEVDERVRPISTLGDPVDPLVIDDYVTEPAYDPVIGPELTAARTRLGLSVDELAERTRIRPHVIESIEVDDFAPCGGDFYARGHLRTLARILGKDAEPLLARFEERYATAPINARRVFEAELATGMTGSMRSTVGGPNWGLLVGVVLSLVLVWGVVRLFTTEPVEMVEVPAPVLDGSAGVDNGYPGRTIEAPRKAGVVEPVTVRLSASQSDSQVVVRDGDGMVVFSGELVLGERKTLRLAPPVRIRASDGGAVEVRVAGRDRGPLGELGEPARRTFR